MLEEVLCGKLCKCRQRTAGECFLESGFVAVCQFRKHSSFGKFCRKALSKSCKKAFVLYPNNGGCSKAKVRLGVR